MPPAPAPVDPNAPKAARQSAELTRHLKDARAAYAQALASWDALMAQQTPPATDKEIAAQRDTVAIAKAQVEVLEKVLSRSTDTDQ